MDRNASALAETAVRRRTYAAAALALAFAAATAPSPARGAEPLCDWLLSLGRAAQAQADRNYVRAEAEASRALRARPRGPAAARAQASLGVALLALEEPARAAEALEVALGSPVPARLHLSAARAEALLAAGDAPHAARLFAEAGRGGELAVARTAALREAQALLASGLAAEAVPQLDAFARHATDPAAAATARLALAQGQRALGQDDLAVGTLRSLWLELPDRPEARAAGETLAAWRAAGGPVPPESAADHVARAERLVVAGRPEEALVDLDAAARADDPEASAERAALLRAFALLALGQQAEAERVALPLTGARDDGVQRGARLVLARVAARAGRVEEASRFHADVGHGRAAIPGLPDWKQRDVGDESAFLSAWLFYDAGAYERGIAALEAFARANPRSRRAEDALWFAAWARYRLGRSEEADRAFARLAHGPLADAALYWRGRLARGPAAQRALYRSALAMGGDGWYGLLARIRLARDHLPATRRTLRWLYPEPLPELLPATARRCGVDPALLLSVMRRESSFRPDVRSNAGAEGLLQLRPATAERLGAMIGLGAGIGARLKEPEVAIPVGAHYLGLLITRFGEPALAVAAYNAGPAPVAAWASDRAGMPLDAWVESIPYRETRGYVKVVLAEWDVYRAVAGEPTPPIDPDRRVKAPASGVAF